MQWQHEMFAELLGRLEDEGVLRELILVGSWCLPVYREMYAPAPQIPALRTKDLDFFVADPNHVRRKVDVAALLRSMDFEPKFDVGSELVKYVRSDFDVEFLAARNRSKATVLKIPELNIEAQALSYMELVPKYAVEFRYLGHALRVPELAAFVLHKALVQPLRQNPEKAAKDADTVFSLGDLVCEREELRERCRMVFGELPGKWKSRILAMLSEHAPRLRTLLVS